MKRLSFAFACLLVFSWFSAAVAYADPEGVWRTADGKATIRISHCGGGFCGYVTSVPASVKDDKNPDPKLRGRSVANMEVLIEMRPAGANLWQGRAYDSDTGQYYAAKISLVSEQALKVEGCPLGGGICGSETWSRVR
jgi:uncharacterized protein (DUF2147 family)